MTTPYILLEGCKVLSVHDGDTFKVWVDIDGLPDWRPNIRPIDLWCAELKDAGGPEATAYARSLLLHESVTLKIPYEVGKGLDQLFTFERLLAHVTLPNGTDFAQNMVSEGHATKTKPKKPRPRKSSIK